MLVIKKNSRIGKRLTERGASLKAGGDRELAAADVTKGTRVLLARGDHAGKVGRVMWIGEGKSLGMYGVGVRGVKGLVFEPLSSLRTPRSVDPEDLDLREG